MSLSRPLEGWNCEKFPCVRRVSEVPLSHVSRRAHAQATDVIQHTASCHRLNTVQRAGSRKARAVGCAHKSLVTLRNTRARFRAFAPRLVMMTDLRRQLCGRFSAWGPVGAAMMLDSCDRFKALEGLLFHNRQSRGRLAAQGVCYESCAVRCGWRDVARR